MSFPHFCRFFNSSWILAQNNTKFIFIEVFCFIWHPTHPWIWLNSGWKELKTFLAVWGRTNGRKEKQWTDIGADRFFSENVILDVLSTLANAMLASFVLKKGRTVWAVLSRHFVWRTKICTYQNFSLPHFLKSLSCNI